MNYKKSRAEKAGEQIMETLEAIDQKIAKLEKEKRECKGTKTDVYTRIVGYYRRVQNFNEGKREEYRQRKTFSIYSNEDFEKRKKG